METNDMFKQTQRDLELNIGSDRDNKELRERNDDYDDDNDEENDYRDGDYDNED